MNYIFLICQIKISVGIHGHLMNPSEKNNLNKINKSNKYRLLMTNSPKARK